MNLDTFVAGVIVGTMVSVIYFFHWGGRLR